MERSEMRESGVVTAGDREYDSLRASFNGMVDKRPVQINICSSVEDVVAAVRSARERRLPIAVRGGGHSVAGHSVGDGALVVDLRGMRRVEVDPHDMTATAQGGATWGDYDTATQEYGLASTGGTFTDTGIAGLTLGGGIGYLQGTQGYAVDTLAAVRLVTADGEIITASEEENADLFWAVRGAGANFGVIVEFTYRLRPVGELYGGVLNFPLSAAGDVLAATRDLAQRAPDKLVLQCVLGRRYGDSAVLVCFQGSAREGEQLLQPVRRAAVTAADSVRPLSYLEMQATNELFPFGIRHYWKGRFLNTLPDDLIAKSAEHIGRRPESGFGTLLIEFIGGAPRRVPADSMAFGEREATVNASGLGIWPSPADDEPHIAWAQAYSALLEPHATQAEYVNYMAPDTTVDRVRAAYGDAKYARLQELKRRFDPDNTFRFNHNIRP